MFRRKKNFTDEELIQGIVSGGRKRRITLEWILNNWGQKQVRIWVAKKIFKEDAVEVVHDAILKLTEKIELRDFKRGSRLETYFSGIVKNMMLNRRRQMARKKALVLLHDLEHEKELHGEVEQVLPSDPLYQLVTKDMQVKIGQFLQTHLSERCKEILDRYFPRKYGGYTSKEIADEMNGTSEGIRKEKQRCIQKLKNAMGGEEELMKYLIKLGE